ncbi:MAG: phospholipase [Ignavibacteriae bacterium]|nr:phospholipase [Ignavibacteriota bacterium]MCB9216371.1 phospholipase [Ignavibacteria bacterium]
MLIQENLVETRRSARYFVAGEINPSVRHVWFVLHGYGQLGEDFLGDCMPLLREGTVLVAPEALSRFYHRSGRGSIGASWMTSEDRLREIDDYLIFLNGIWESIVTQIGTIPELSILGFSQGGATAMRWGCRGEGKPRRIVLWGAGFPEVELEAYRDRLSQMTLLLIQGREDRIVSKSEIEKTVKKLQEIGGGVEQIYHSGGHELRSEVLADIVLK